MRSFLRLAIPLLAVLLLSNAHAHAQCTAISSAYDITYTLDEATTGTYPYTIDVLNNEGGNGNRVEVVNIEIGPTADTLSASATVAVWTESIATAPAGFRALRYTYASGTVLKSGATETFSYDLNEQVTTSLRVQTVQKNGQTDLVTFDDGNCPALFGGGLPVELTSFTAQARGHEALLRWVTASETQSAGFEVEHRAPDASDFAPAGFVPSQGVSTGMTTYEHVVASLTPGRHAFRLRQVDTDGTSAYGPVVELLLDAPGAALLAAPYPNPARSAARFSLSLAVAQTVRVDVVDVQGRRVAQLFEGTLEAGTAHPFTVDAAGLPSGVYLVRATGERFSATRSFIITR